jgi:hypothetical protein
MNKRIVVKPPEDIPRRIYAVACSRCPSAHYPPDPEAQDIAKLPKEERIRHVFVCGWRRGALCKGVCDELGVTDADLDHPDLGRAP